MDETRGPSGEPELPYAALDLGSNSFHLIVAEDKPGRLHVVDKHREMVRLAEGLDEANELRPDVTERAIQCLERIGQRLRGLPRHHVRVVGTNTLRRATNGLEFIADAEAALGHKIEIISGREEARLIYLGVSYSLEDHHASRLVVDIGGGSTEVILGRQLQPRLLESLHLGCVSMSHRYFGDGRIKAAAMKRAVDAARQEIKGVRQIFKAHGWDRAIGASGTIIAIRNALTEGFDQSRITRGGLETLTTALVEAKHVDEVDLPGVNRERAPVFPGGVAILSALFDELGIDEMVVAGGALREGLLQDLIGRVHAEDIREMSVDDLIRRYHIDLSHALRVAATAADLLQQVSREWDVQSIEDSNLLRWSAMLHEIGMDISHSSYHKHGGYLLEHMDLPGFSQYEQQRLSLLVRGHRRKFPIGEIGERSAIAKLCILLRLAIVLHRGRSDEAPPALALAADDDALTVSVPAMWLDAHPLTELDLAQEAEHLRAAGRKLEVVKS